MFAYRKALDVLENASSCAQFGNQTDEFLHELVARVIEHSASDEREPLTWRASENDIDGLSANPGAFAQLLPG